MALQLKLITPRTSGNPFTTLIINPLTISFQPVIHLATSLHFCGTGLLLLYRPFSLLNREQT